MAPDLGYLCRDWHYRRRALMISGYEFLVRGDTIANLASADITFYEVAQQQAWLSPTSKSLPIFGMKLAPAVETTLL
jgi:hypothetical protein